MPNHTKAIIIDGGIGERSVTIKLQSQLGINIDSEIVVYSKSLDN